MTIINHGKWIRYKPDRPMTPLPEREGLPLNMGILYLKRESDGVDWYAYQKDGAFIEDSVKLVVEEADGKHFVRAAAVDVARMFPAGALVIELADVIREQDENALIDEFSNRVFDMARGQVMGPKPRAVSGTETAIAQILERLDRIEQRLKEKH
jgi:hypothetical protein